MTWPPTQPRTPQRQRARFATSFAVARSKLRHELRLLGAEDVVVSSNVPLRLDGLTYATFKAPPDPGVAIWFTRAGRQLCLACDRWTAVEDNLHAVGKTVDALRGIERWGTAAMLEAAFTGFAALPDPRADPWWDVLNLARDATLAEIEAAYRRLARVHHPDAGGSHEQFLRVTAAYEQAKGQVA